jgi:CheY-like chemotaxis protein
VLIGRQWSVFGDADVIFLSDIMGVSKTHDLRGLSMSNPYKVLLVDDNEDFIEVLSMDVEDLGFTVKTALSVDAALELLANEPLDIVVSDLHMEGKSGMDFIFELRESNNMIPFIFLTGAATKAVAVEALRHGAFDLLEKPIEPEELARVLNSAGRLVNRIHSDDGQGSVHRQKLRTSAAVFDDLAGEDEGVETYAKPAFSSEAFVVVAEEGKDYSVPEQASKDALFERKAVRMEINKLLLQNQKAIHMLEHSTFMRTSLSFLSRSYNLIRESAEQIEDTVLAEACDTACNCFAHFRVHPKALLTRHIEVFREYNTYLMAQNAKGNSALKEFESALQAVQSILRRVTESAA